MALYVTVEDGNVTFNYIGKDGKEFNREDYSNIVDTTYYEDFDTLGAIAADGKTINLSDEADISSVHRADLYIDRPVIGTELSQAREYSSRFSISTVWSETDSGKEVTSFDYGKAYTAAITLSAASGITFDFQKDELNFFDGNGIVIDNDYIRNITSQISSDGSSAVIYVGFTPTPTKASSINVANTLGDDGQFAIASENLIYKSSCGTTDAVVEGNEIITDVDADAYWAFHYTSGAYTMQSSAGQYMTVAVNGPNIVLKPEDQLEGASNYLWNIDQAGRLYAHLNKTTYYMSEENGKFKLITSTDSANVRVFTVTAGTPHILMCFNDVYMDDWFYEYVVTCGMEGNEDGSFLPNATVTWNDLQTTGLLSDVVAGNSSSAEVTRLEVSKLVAKVLGLSESVSATPFADTDDGLVTALYEANIITGSFTANGELVFEPDRPITKAEVAAILARIS